MVFDRDDSNLSLSFSLSLSLSLSLLVATKATCWYRGALLPASACSGCRTKSFQSGWLFTSTFNLITISSLLTMIHGFWQLAEFSRSTAGGTKREVQHITKYHVWDNIPIIRNGKWRPSIYPYETSASQKPFMNISSPHRENIRASLLHYIVVYRCCELRYPTCDDLVQSSFIQLC